MNLEKSIISKHVKISGEEEKVNETQRFHKLHPINYKKYHNKIGHVYGVKGDVVTVQFYINDKTEHIWVHENLLIYVANQSCDSASNNSEIISKIVKSDKTGKKGSLHSTENFFRQNSNLQCERKLEEIISAIKDPNNNDIKPLCLKNVHINDKDPKQQTALHCAAYYGKICHIKTLLDCGCELNSTDDDGDTAVHIAIYNEQYDSIDFLINENPSFLETKNLKGETPLLLAAKKKNDKIFSLLLKKNDKVINERDNDGNASLHFFVKNNNVELVKKLLSNKNLDIDIMNKSELSSFYHACYYGHKEIINCFINYCKRKKDFSHINKLMLEQSSHQILIRHKHYDIAKWLINEHPILWSKHSVSSRHGSILHTAVSHLQLEIVRSLIHLNEDIIELKNRNGETALDIALKMYNENSEINNVQSIKNIAKLLIAKGKTEIMPSNKKILNNLLNSYHQ